MNANLRLAALAAVPFVLVQGARLMLGGGPAASNAASVEPTPMLELPEPFAPPPFGEQDRALVAWIDAQPAITRSPMAGASAGASPAARARENHVTAVIGRGANAIANIDGKLYRVGDEYEPGWTVRRIEGLAVELASVEGKTRTLGKRE